ncbi:Ni/Fe hydrogenase subunit alpha [Desulfurobacterium atlanticum]|uniref:Sulfhydrogenase subunit alpha n=1 Tax=Desulfurobacterium atlanticum TaxID=240169 RepID=A0A238XKB1_9BACT|nr:Ni/Fe hydrogenase subunit alpha [Desulfurobacterium atlanticum]SNR59112.1 sulfhydrogenase subunit alpha [Desulfurobacterium atlanticum]
MRREVKVEHLTRVEGHGAIEIVFEEDKVKDVKVRITEGPRFYEYTARDRLWGEIPKVMSRICGICYVSHRIASVRAIEDAFDVSVPEPIELLRKLLIVGEFFESHSLHVYFLALPDYMGYNSALEMAKEYPNVVKRAFKMKNLGNKIMKTITGKHFHGENIVPGGFATFPSKDELLELKENLEDILVDAKDTIKLFDSLEYPEFNAPFELQMAISKEHFSLVGDEVYVSNGTVFTKNEFEMFVVETFNGYSMAKQSTIEGKPFLVGPLARVNLHLDSLRPETKEIMKDMRVKFPSANILHQNVARTIELFELALEGIELIDKILENYPAFSVVDIKPKKGSGFGLKEAPRGTLYHKYSFDENGRCISANVITPTAQLQANMERDLRSLAEKLVSADDETIKKYAEMVIRSYDPCISCSVHMFKAEFDTLKIIRL